MNWRESSVGQSSPKSTRGSLAKSVLADLAADKTINIELPGGGRLHLDRRAPKICVYRCTTGDAGTESLISAEPAFMVVPAEARSALQALKLLRSIVDHIVEYFGSCLVVEVWTADPEEASGASILVNG